MDSLDPILFRDCVEDDRFPFFCKRFAKSFVNNGESRNCALLFSAGESFFLDKSPLLVPGTLNPEMFAFSLITSFIASFLRISSSTDPFSKSLTFVEIADDVSTHRLHRHTNLGS